MTLKLSLLRTRTCLDLLIVDNRVVYNGERGSVKKNVRVILYI